MRTRWFKILFLAVLTMPVLAGCNTPPPQQNLPQITFAHLGKFRLAASGVEIVDRYAPPLKEPNIEHTVPVSPVTAMKRWGADRLQAEGGVLQARFIINRASMVEVPLETKKGITGAFTTDQSERYEVVVEGVVELVDAAGNRRAVADAKAIRSRTVPEDSTLNEREKVQFELVEAVMDDFDAEMENNIRRYLAEYLKN